MKIAELFKKIIVIFIFLSPVFAWSAADTDDTWNNVLKTRYFGNHAIEESSDVVELTAPYRAEDPAMVPLKITSKFPQTLDKYIRKITILIDKNPEPFVGEFTFSEFSGRADLALRVRVNAYTNIRAIAELNSGKLSMHKVYVKASGGCSAPIAADLEAAMNRLGKMKFKVNDNADTEMPLLTQLMISHPNITGMQMDQVTRIVKPAHFVQHLAIKFNDKLVLTAKTDIAVSEDPNFRFYFVPHEAGTLEAEIQDNKGMVFSTSYEVIR